MKLFDLLIPPVNADPELTRRWRIAISLSLIAMYVTVPAMFGFVPGIPPVLASASEMREIKDEMKELKEDLKEDRIDRLDQQIESAVKDHCLADTQKSKSYYNKNLTNLKRKYRDIDPGYAPPTCSDVGVPYIQATTP